MQNTAELVFVPGPGIGHLLSTVRVAKFLLQTTSRISISILVIDFLMDSAKLTAYVDSQSRNNPYPTRLTFVTFPLVCDRPEGSFTELFTTIIQLHKPLVRQVVEDRVRAGSGRPVGFILDMFCMAVADVANELHIPSYLYLTLGAASVAFLFHAQALADGHGLKARDLAREFSDPGFSSLILGYKNPLTSGVIPPLFQDKEGACEMMLDLARQFRGMKGILMNTYEELEPFAVHALQYGDDKNIPPVYPVGPILELDGKKGQESDDIMQWLDRQPESSVVFLCFGTVGGLDEEQVRETAKGLDRSGHRFLWALRKPPSEGEEGIPCGHEAFPEALPDGFLERTSHRGKIIGWAPQVEILAHPAIGGFVSHCGWNSVLESLWFGVPIATWPMYSEQPLNAFELVKELGLAVEIRMDYKRDWKSNKGIFLVTAEEIEQGLNKLMNMDDEKMRGNVKEMSKKGKKALEKGGSSYNWLCRFVDDVLKNIP